MPFFNFRRNGSSPPSGTASAAQHESVEVIRQRAKHRLIGAAVLVLAGVVGFPLLFDTQPRPIAGDIPIEIPGKNTVKPLVIPAKQAASAPVPLLDTGLASAAGTPVANASLVKAPVAPAVQTDAELPSPKKSLPLSESAPIAIKKETKSEPKPEAKVDAKSVTKSAIKLDVPVDDGARATALLNGSAAGFTSAPDAASSRLIVQVGAFADVTKAREVRLKLEKAGFKTYTQVAETKDGKRIRVRVGPYATRSDADKAASKIKTLDLSAAILTL